MEETWGKRCPGGASRIPDSHDLTSASSPHQVLATLGMSRKVCKERYLRRYVRAISPSL